MADTKITGLISPQVTTNPATDVLPIVNIADTLMASSGSTRKITVNQLLGAGGTATLASATITGDLTVDTSTLKVDSANDRVGVGTVSPTAKLHVSSTGSVHINQRTGGNGCFTQYVDPVSSNYVGTDSGNFRVVNNSSQDLLNIQQLGVFTFGDGAGGTRMTLNATGLGVGGSPLDKFTVVGNSFLRGAAAGVRIGDGGGYGFISAYDQTLSTAKDLVLQTGGGNVGVGVTPSAWGASYKSIDIAGGAALSGLSTQTFLTCNAYDSSGWKKKASGYANLLLNTSGEFRFYVSNAGAGSAGDAITYNQNMTLDASGNLLVGKTAAGFGTVGNEVKGNGEVFSTQSSSSNAATTYHVYSTTAAAYRFYVGLGGTVYATNTTISAISDARLKENVQDIDVGLGAILALKPRKFDWKAGKGKDIKGDRGFIAQEFEQVFPQLVDEWKDNAPEGEAPYKSVRQDLIPVLVKAIQELAAEVNALKNA